MRKGTYYDAEDGRERGLIIIINKCKIEVTRKNYSNFKQFFFLTFYISN